MQYGPSIQNIDIERGFTTMNGIRLNHPNTQMVTM